MRTRYKFFSHEGLGVPHLERSFSRACTFREHSNQSTHVSVTLRERHEPIGGGPWLTQANARVCRIDASYTLNQNDSSFAVLVGVGTVGEGNIPDN